MSHLLTLKKFAVAVSGGSDSVALLMLVNQLAKENNIELHILTVNHNLRKQANIEIEYIKDLTTKLSHKFCQFSVVFEHFIDFQNQARQKRYSLLTKYCLQHDILVLLTAHHLDDKLENFFIRLNKKSKIFGLSAHNKTYINNTQVFRPLYNYRKNELQQYLINNKITWFEDQSNEEEKYLRNYIRKLLNSTFLNQELIEILNETDKIAQDFTNLLAQGLIKTTYLNSNGFGIIDLEKFAELFPLIKFQLISYILTILGGKLEAPRKRSLQPILELLSHKLPINKTIHGCRLKKIEKNLLIFRDFNRYLPLEVDVKQSNHWDNRFRIDFQLINLENIKISCLNNFDYNNLKKLINSDFKNLNDKKLTKLDLKAILFTFPVVKILEKVIAIPNINYYYGNWKEKISCHFDSKFKSRFIHFN